MARSKFNLGDKVKVVRIASQMTREGIKLGDIVTVTGTDAPNPRLDGGDNRCCVNGLGNNGFGFDDSRFELVEAAREIKVGDKVRIVRAVKTHDANGMGLGKKWENSWVGRMDALVGDGKVYTVQPSYGSDAGGFRLQGQEYNWPTAAMELVEDDTNGVNAKGERIKFATADLKAFQRVTFRNGESGIVTYSHADGIMRVLDADGGPSLKARLDYRKEGTAFANCTSGYDIVAVYAAPEDARYAADPTVKGELVWQAQDAAETQRQAELKRKQDEADKAVALAKEALAKAEATRAALK